MQPPQEAYREVGHWSHRLVGPHWQTMNVLSVYLDQNKWVDLARADHGVAGSESYRQVLTDIRRAVAEQRAQFPLSTAHYFETYKAGDAARRLRLAQTMQSISGGLRIAPPQAIVPHEITQAFALVFGVDAPDEVVEVFGHRAAHSLASPALGYEVPTTFNGVDLPEQIQSQVRANVEPLMELALLSGAAPPNMPAEMSDGMRVIIREHQVSIDANLGAALLE